MGWHSDLANTYFVKCDSHNLDEIIAAYKTHGAYKISAEFCNSEGWIDQKGNYFFEDSNIFLSPKQVAERFNVPQNMVVKVAPSVLSLNMLPTVRYEIKLGEILKGEKRE